ncbi:MAG: SDR family NAD(P)-dependent oxidoreductase [Propionibacteriales bacterium]|nr:SDR family NAD(P)-dependent oxidoreductase [Propionibacteriales bacterium]
MSNSIAFDFSGTTVLVTGGTSGIGHGIATAFRDAGALVTVTGTRASADEYDVDLSAMAYRRLAMTSDADVIALGSSFSSLDVLVNNAGATFAGGLDEYDPAGFDEALRTNLSGGYRLTHACHGALAASEATGGGSVVNLVSMAAYRAVTLVPGYAAAKAGLVSVTQNLAARWAGDGIRVNAIAPGNIETPMTAPMAAVPSIVDEQIAHIPMKRFGTVAEIVPAALFLSSAQASYVTGAVLAVDGGYLTY